MESDLLLFSRIASTAIEIIADRVTKIIMAIPTNTDAGVSAISAAEMTHGRLFFWYMVVLITGAVIAALFAIVAAWFTFKVWQSGNAVSEAVRIDALARIHEADAVGKQAQDDAGKANEKAGIANNAAAQANRRAEELENSNLSLSAKIESLKKDNLSLGAGLLAQKERTAKAETELIKAQSELLVIKKRVNPRGVDPVAFSSLMSLWGATPPPDKIEIMYVKDDPECFTVAQLLYQAIRQSGWDALNPVPLSGSPEDKFSDRPTAMAAGGQPSGISVIAHSRTEAEFSAFPMFPNGTWVKTPYTVLSNAILQTLGGVGNGAGGETAPPEGTLRVVVAPRM